MKPLLIGFVLISLAIFHDVAFGGGWGPTFAIEIHGHDLDAPLTITEPSIVEGLSFWVGPGTGFSEFMGPVAYNKSIVDWDQGEVLEKREALPRYEVRFLLGSRDDPATFTVLYEPDPSNKSGYIYYPRKSSGIVTHGVDGTWRYASARWNDEVGAAIADQNNTTQGTATIDREPLPGSHP